MAKAKPKAKGEKKGKKSGKEPKSPKSMPGSPKGGKSPKSKSPRGKRRAKAKVRILFSQFLTVRIFAWSTVLPFQVVVGISSKLKSQIISQLTILQSWPGLSWFAHKKGKAEKIENVLFKRKAQYQPQSSLITLATFKVLILMMWICFGLGFAVPCDTLIALTSNSDALIVPWLIPNPYASRQIKFQTNKNFQEPSVFIDPYDVDLLEQANALIRQDKEDVDQKGYHEITPLYASSCVRLFVSIFQD